MHLLDKVATIFGMFFLVALGATLLWGLVIWLINRKFINQTGAFAIWVVTIGIVTLLCYLYQ